MTDQETPVEDRTTSTATGWVVKTIYAVFLLLLGAVLWMWATWPDVGGLATRNPETTAFIERYRENQRAEGRSDEVRWQIVPYDQISPNLKRAVISSEDTEFFFHAGFSTHELKESIRKAVEEREAPRGASTITQQLAKNLWLAPDRSYTRKLREAILTRQLESALSKERILDLYLNVVEFGPGIYGAEAASQAYFGLPAARLSPRQGAMLAAGLPRPSQWNPRSTSDNYARAVERILDVQRRLAFLDKYFGPMEGAPAPIDAVPPTVDLDVAPVDADEQPEDTAEAEIGDEAPGG